MYYEVYVDGASRGQGTGRIGQAAIGIAIYKNERMIGQYARGLGRRTNNEAEYEAILCGLQLCWAADLRDPVIYSDSLVVVNHINGVWRCKTAGLRPLLLSVWEIRDAFRFRLIHVPRPQVWEADALCNLFLDKLASLEQELL